MTTAARTNRAFRWLVPHLPVAVVIGLVGAVNFYLAGRSIGLILDGAPAIDWLQFVEAGDRVERGGLYEASWTYAYRWSPVLAYLFALLGGMGTLVWRLLHVAAALALPTWPIRLVTLASWPFWYDVEAGNVMVFVLLAAAWAVRGSRVATGALLMLTLVIPRPLMLPVAIWLLWHRPEWRLPFVGLIAIHLVAVVASGWAVEWFMLLTTLGSEMTWPNNLSPTRLIGSAWLVFAIPLTALLTWRGRLGWASLTASYPYLLPYYLIMLVLELGRGRFLSSASR
jgi:hypothetical protein